MASVCNVPRSRRPGPSSSRMSQMPMLPLSVHCNHLRASVCLDPLCSAQQPSRPNGQVCFAQIANIYAFLAIAHSVCQSTLCARRTNGGAAGGVAAASCLPARLDPYRQSKSGREFTALPAPTVPSPACCLAVHRMPQFWLVASGLPSAAQCSMLGSNVGVPRGMTSEVLDVRASAEPAAQRPRAQPSRRCCNDAASTLRPWTLRQS